MSALPPKAVMAGGDQHARFVPISSASASNSARRSAGKRISNRRGSVHKPGKYARATVLQRTRSATLHQSRRRADAVHRNHEDHLGGGARRRSSRDQNADPRQLFRRQCKLDAYQIQDRTHGGTACQYGCNSSAPSEFGRNRRDRICTLRAVETSVRFSHLRSTLEFAP
jgi:hypothetical protein